MTKTKLFLKNHLILVVIVLILILSAAYLVTFGLVYVSFSEPAAPNTLPSGTRFCVDYDGGLEFSVKGKTTLTEGTSITEKIDYCVDGSNELREFYCESNKINSIYVECTGHGSRCSDGACV
ncbi:MAG: hypothetical protein ABIF08_01385 [Nanoarchaeota archaeon]